MEDFHEMEVHGALIYQWLVFKSDELVRDVFFL
jgi:hypothetical protein